MTDAHYATQSSMLGSPRAQSEFGQLESDAEYFDVDPWAIRESTLDLDELGRTESIFALSNGHIGMRGNLEEGEPTHIPGTYLNGVHEVLPLSYAEIAYGNPEAGETVLNVTDGKLIRLSVGDELFDVRYGELLHHERVLDLRDGVLRRQAHWRSPTGREVKVSTTRIVSLVQRGTAAILYEVEPIGKTARLVVQSELVTNEDGQREEVNDPRAAAVLRSPLHSEEHGSRDAKVLLIHATSRSNLRTAAAMDHQIDGPSGMVVESESTPDTGRVTITVDVKPGEKLRIVKFLTYAWSSRRSLASVRAQVLGSLAEARHAGWDGLCDMQREYLDRFWEAADVEIEGDDDLQQAIRFGLFHLLQCAVRAERRAIPAKGLTGSGYDGHAFWDSEAFVLPVLTYVQPQAAGDALRWRHATIALAHERARQLGLAGAAFPWRTIAGRECSGYWPASTAAFHVNAAIADAVIRYQHAVDDPSFELEAGVPILVETARLWISLGHHNPQGSFRIEGVTGPDEYSCLADNNLYTNLMAARNLDAAADAAERHPDLADELGVTTDEIAAWRHAAETMFIPYDEHRGVHQQSEGFTNYAWWDFENTPAEHYPLLLNVPYFDLYRKQVIKQADLVLALYTCGDRFTDDEKRRNFEYYEQLTVRDSSLSACTQAIIAAETGHLGLAHDYLSEAALMDLHDLAHNTADGIHMASMAGGWLAVVAGFGGFRDHGGNLSFAPRLPDLINRISYKLNFRGKRLAVEVRHGETTYRLEQGDELTIHHCGEEVVVRSGEPVRRSYEVPERGERPRQPAGREPRIRHGV